MKAKLISMLTCNDRTVDDALAVFRDCRRLACEFWGFKDVGISVDAMKTLVSFMKDEGKKTFLEIVSYTEAECMLGAKLAVECGFDYLMGTIFHESIWEYVRKENIRYLPFVGKVHSSPSILDGTVTDIVNQAKQLAQNGVAGLDLLAYRHQSQAERIAKEVVAVAGVPVVIAGSIDREERIAYVEEIGAWAYTIGSAFFNESFVRGKGFRGNLEHVLRCMNRL